MPSIIKILMVEFVAFKDSFRGSGKSLKNILMSYSLIPFSKVQSIDIGNTNIDVTAFGEPRLGQHCPLLVLNCQFQPDVVFDVSLPRSQPVHVE